MIWKPAPWGVRKLPRAILQGSFCLFLYGNKITNWKQIHIEGTSNERQQGFGSRTREQTVSHEDPTVFLRMSCLTGQREQGRRKHAAAETERWPCSQTSGLQKVRTVGSWTPNTALQSAHSTSNPLPSSLTRSLPLELIFSAKPIDYCCPTNTIQKQPHRPNMNYKPKTCLHMQQRQCTASVFLKMYPSLTTAVSS